MKPPLISVILCTRNPGGRLLEALNSVQAQTFRSFETILVDGASDDGSIAALPLELKKALKIHSEQDSGVYQAMNRGVRMASGQWLYFMGADDQLADPEVLSDVARELSLCSEELCAGIAQYRDGRAYRGSLTRLAARNFLHHQGTFYRKSLLDRHGVFDEQLRIQADYDFNLRVALGGARLALKPRLIALCGCGGLSDGGRWANYAEEIHIRHRHFPAWQCWGWDALSLLRFARKRLRCSLRARRR